MLTHSFKKKKLHLVCFLKILTIAMTVIIMTRQTWPLPQSSMESWDADMSELARKK